MKRNITDLDIQAAKRLKSIWNERKDLLGLTQDRAADLLGFATQGAVSHYLNAKTPLNLEAVLKFAGLLQVPPEEIRPDMIEILQIARQYTSGSAPIPLKAIVAPLTEIQKKLVDLAEDLPESDTREMINNMEMKRDFYRRKVEELLQKRNKPA